MAIIYLVLFLMLIASMILILIRKFPIFFKELIGTNEDELSNVDYHEFEIIIAEKENDNIEK